MCGIVGFITQQSKVGEDARSKFFKQALIIDTLRGDDSTGMFLVGHEPEFDDGTPYWYKQVGTGAEFVDTKEYWEHAYETSGYRAMVGHNRAATVGSVDADSAHPFQEGPITLVHNGTLTSTSGLPNPMSGLKGVTVDSHAICHNLANHDPEEVISNLHGAFALVWHDARDDSINVVRNSQRPLHFALGQNGKTLFFMSEGGMLHMLDQRIKLGLRSIYYPDEGQHLKWLPDTPLDRPIHATYDLYSAYAAAYNTYYTGGYGSGYAGRHGGYSYGDDPWEDDIPFGGGNTSGKAQAHDEREDYIFVGGRRRAIPMLVQETLLTYDIVVEDRLHFTPTSVGLNPQDKSKYYVLGTLEGRHKAIIYSCHSSPASGGDWCVRVTGVKVTASGEPWFICRLVSTFCNPVIMTSTKRKPRGKLAYDRVPGPDGDLITEAEWHRHTVDGCVMCTAPIGVRDAWDLIWTAEGPICPNCDDRLYEPPNHTINSIH